jgi:hypothetical protein
VLIVTTRQRIFIAGLGALLPIFILLLTFDPGSLEKAGSLHQLSALNILGWAIRIVALFAAGALVGWLNANENKPITVFQIGIAAPALLASFVAGSAHTKTENAPLQSQNSPPISTSQKVGALSNTVTSFFISSAQAQNVASNATLTSNAQKPQSAWRQIYEGFTGQYTTAAPSAVPSTTLSQVSLLWENATGDNIPANAFKAGSEKIRNEELPIYICRAEHMGGVHPGKVRKGLAGCDITFGHHELSIPKYQVLMTAPLKWAPSANGIIPGNAVAGGKDIPPASEELYLCRGIYPNENGLHPGKIRKNFGGCSIGWGGHIAIVKQYDVLTE